MSRRDATHLRDDSDAGDTDQFVPPTVPGRPGPWRTVLAALRNIWRQLTSMRVALVLLFLLALASLPGALLPQWSLNQAKTAQWILDNPTWGPILDNLGFFAVFGSPWYSAIYLLLFISLIGCLTPRTFDFVKQLRAQPVITPRNLARMPHHGRADSDASVLDTADRIQAGLKRWRSIRREEPSGAVTISAEKGYLREVGNLAFHISLVGILVAIAVGKLVGYEGTVAVRVGEERCLSTPAAYDNFRPGLLVDGTALDPICTDVQSFAADYVDTGVATAFRIQLRYQTGNDAVAGTNWQQTQVQVNEPLRFDGERLYLLGHGFAPEFTIDYPNGETRNYVANFQPADSFLLSQGSVQIVAPPVTGEDQELALDGIFAPTAATLHGSTVLTSIFPRPDKPAVAIQVYQGDLGVSPNVFELNQDQIDSGALKKLNRANLFVGDSMTIPDGTRITFTGYQDWVSLQVSYDPAQGYALIFAITMILGLMMSLTIKRRRVWYRISAVTSDNGELGRTVVEVGGLARTDQAGYGAEFGSMVGLVGPTTVKG